MNFLFSLLVPVGVIALWCLSENLAPYNVQLNRYTAQAARQKSGFLLFPKSIQGDIRWLSRQTWKQEYLNVPGGMGFEGWFDVEWAAQP